MNEEIGESKDLNMDETRGRKAKIKWSEFKGQVKVFNWRELGYKSLNSVRVSLASAKKRGLIDGYSSKVQTEDEIMVSVK